MAGINATTTSTFIIPNFSATNPNADIIIATTPHEKPFIKPAIILLYSGKTFCAISMVTGVASMVINPINTKTTNDNIGNFGHIIRNKSIIGKVEIMEI